MRSGLNCRAFSGGWAAVLRRRARLVAESERLGRALLNSISHELRTPLAASTSAVSMLVGNPALPAEQRSTLLGEIQEANARLNRVVGNLLGLSRIEAGQLRVKCDWHDARDLIRTVLAGLARELGCHPVRVSVGTEALLARMDFHLMEQALGNLMHNAAVHTPSGTPIEVGASLEPGWLNLTVSDGGPGIEEGLVPHLFEKFRRGVSAPPGGSGLGLAIARGFVEAHGGAITAGNRQGGGAEFIIRLPQAEAPPVFHGS